ncbi:NB-ARC domain-containing disease resistance protein [Melia azedarach]|uniref:NB-ARC domain-containing disease resistance protein n=1 Tax=Melia azedarach TaxID=155640 RepID=A0ACC1Y7R8_MELAZ|nr:NB-ARC domain-containing disease resistance protein [Melia azedarach]
MCARLRNLVTLLAVESLGKLERMKIIDSIMIEKIIDMQVKEEANENAIVFRQLEYLEVGSLPIIESFCSENCTLEFPYLEQVVVSGCPSMKTFSKGVLCTPRLHKLQLAEEERWEGNLNLTVQRLFERMAKFCGLKYLKLSQSPRVEEIWHDQVLPVSYFNNLKWLVVDDCPFMSSAIPANLLRFLNNLEILEVRNCDSIEEVFHLEDLIADRYFGPLFPKLENLKLENLPKLRRFCDFDWNISEMPKLDYLLIENCSKMETFYFR